MVSTNSIDTNIVVRCLTDDDFHQRKLVHDLLSTPNAVFCLEDVALSEVVYVLSGVYQKSRSEIINLLNFFLARYSSSIKYNRALTAAVFPFYLEHPKLSFNDCCLAYYAEANHAEPLFTFDRKLAKQHSSAKLLA